MLQKIFCAICLCGLISACSSTELDMNKPVEGVISLDAPLEEIENSANTTTQFLGEKQIADKEEEKNLSQKNSDEALIEYTKEKRTAADEAIEQFKQQKLDEVEELVNQYKEEQMQKANEQIESFRTQKLAEVETAIAEFNKLR